MKSLNLIVIVTLTAVVASPMTEEELAVQATSISDVKNQIANTQNQLENINEEIDRLSDEQDLIEEKIADLNAEIINTMTSIGMKEEEIAVKETEIVDKQKEIDATQAEYEAAKAREEQQYNAMLVHTKNMYETGAVTQLGLLLESGGLGEMLNRIDFLEQIYEYDQHRLSEFEATKNQVHDLWDLLELEKTDLESAKVQLEADRVGLQTQKENLDGMLAQKKRDSANYDAEIKRAKQEAAVAKRLLQQEQALLKQLEARQNAANATYKDTDYTAIIDKASGSDLGKKVAKYACQYIGNPYVYGGTSLTNGADCSGFVYRVYKDFGYNLPRTSYEQRSSGSSVSYDDAQPGDLICYDGHIGIYIGSGKIVHASSAKTGIKVSNAAYRPILSVRRIV